MAEALVAGAALGSAFSELSQTVKNAEKKASTFKSRLKRLESTLDSWQSLIEQIRQLNIVAGHSEEETRGLIQKIEDGNQLVRKCSKVNWWNYCEKAHYGRKLCKLDKDIQKSFLVDFQPFYARNGVEALAVLRDIQTTLNEVSESINLGVLRDLQTTVKEMSQVINLGVRNGRFFSSVPPDANGEVEGAAAQEGQRYGSDWHQQGTKNQLASF